MTARARLSVASIVHGGDVGNVREFAHRGIRGSTDHVVEVKGGSWSWETESRSRQVDKERPKEMINVAEQWSW